MPAMTKEFLESCLAHGLSLKAIGQRVGRSPSTVSYHLKRHGLKPTNQGIHASKGALSKDVLGSLVEQDLSIRAMARELDRSPSTVQYWLRRHGLPTSTRRRYRAQARAARERGETTIRVECRHHGLTEFYVAPNGHYHCKSCRVERVARWRREAKRKLVEAAGGSCCICGYDKCLGSLQFHHLDPATKSFGLAMRGQTRGFESMFEEARKCVLLCANCHFEVERGVTELPSNPRRVPAQQYG